MPDEEIVFKGALHSQVGVNSRFRSLSKHVKDKGKDNDKGWYKGCFQPSRTGADKNQTVEEMIEGESDEIVTAEEDEEAEEKRDSEMDGQSANGKGPKSDVLENYRKRLEEQDSKVVVELFELLLVKMDDVKESVKKTQRKQNAVSRKLSSLPKQDKEMREVAENTTQLIHVSMKQEEDIIGVEKKLDKVESVLNKGSFTIKGLKEHTDESDIEAAENFIAEKLKIEGGLSVLSAHPIGKTGRYRDLWFKLLNPDDNVLIFQNVKKLKDQVNDKEEPYQVQERKSDKDWDKEKRFEDIIMENCRMPASHQLTIKQQKGELLINGEKMVSAIQPTKPTEVLLLDEKAKEELDMLELFEVDSQEEQNSKFYGYIAKTDCFEDVRKVYLKLRREHLNATHIMCGYRIFGSNTPLLQNYSNDGETHGGSKILQELKAAGIFNMTVFIVRYYGGHNLGARRFEIISEMTHDAIARYPGVIDYGQMCGARDTELLNSLGKAVKKYNPMMRQEGDPKYGYGRGRGVRGRTQGR